jgi:hypothetical protein
MKGFTAQTNPRIARDSDIVLKPVHDQNAYRKSVREFAAKQIQIIKAKQRTHITRELNSFGRVAGGEAGFGAPVRNPGYYGVSPPLSYSFKSRPNYSAIIGDRFKFGHLGNTDTSNIPFSNIPATEKGSCCPPKKLNIR